MASLVGFWAPHGHAASMAEDRLSMPTDGGMTHIFLVNPAYFKPSALQGGVLFVRDEKTTQLDQSASGDEQITTNDKMEGMTAAVLLDLGAGAGLGLSHQMLFRSTETTLASQANRPPVVETAKLQHSAVKIHVELTGELRAGMVIRYLYKDVALLGDPFIPSSALTRYKTTMIGYGSGLAYVFDKTSLGCTYFPPLRGKAVIYGEEKIVVESGDIACDAQTAAGQSWRLGMGFKRWIHEIDDLAVGTTAEDNQTRISLYGLNPDQYVLPQQQLSVGLDYEYSKETLFRLALSRETADFNFRDLARYSRIAVQTGSAVEKVAANKLRLMVKFNNKDVELDAGIGFFQRQHEFPERMSGAMYKSQGRELFAVMGVQL